MPKLLSASVLLLLGVVLNGLAHVAPAAADESPASPIKVTLTEAASEFPFGIRFRVQAESDSPITSVAVRLRSPARSRGIYEPLYHRVDEVVDASLFWRAGFGTGYIPPGALLHVSFEIEDAAGNTHVTGFQDFIYQDPRFEWIEISSGSVTVAYHGPVKRRAEDVLETVVQTLETMSSVLGTDPAVPIRATMYNNYGEMLGALPRWIRQLGHELIAEGQAFTDFNTVVLLGSGPQALGTAGHEAVHILTHQAGDGFVSRLPVWLDEGLAEFGNPQPGFSYDIALEFAIETDRLLPVLYMQFLPPDPEDVIIFYGQAKSMVSYMIYIHGPAKIRQLLAQLKSGKPMEEALNSVYGLGIEDLDNSWRRFVGASEYVVDKAQLFRPTPQAVPSLDMYTLDTMPVSPEFEEGPVEASEAEAEAVDPVESTVEPQAPESGSCNARPGGATGMMDVSGTFLAAWLLALAALRFRRRTLC